ncbi:MAG: ribonuclease H-like domain-containing protein [Lachnospiraceae bacterium]|nr:ribonuclease H-like domain-containing protein [Lachnospiraceae bacterium]
MKTIQHEVKINDVSPKSLSFLTEDAILFDIETTGFSSKTSQLYMIGCATLKGEYVCITQFLAEKKEEELSLLTAFFHLCKKYTTCITFNGDGFDISYLKDKCRRLHGEFTLGELHSLDLYKELKGYKNILKLENLKQKTVETFLGISRKDLYTGGELISHYEKYLKTGDLKEEQLLLLHNYEDVLGMIYLLPVLSYPHALQGDFQFKSSFLDTSTDYYGRKIENLILKANLLYEVPKPISYRKDEYYLSLSGKTLSLSCQVQDGNIKVPYLDYKNYYYLPGEDMAILKELASTLGKEEKKPATLANCYGKFHINDENIASEKIMQPYMLKVITLLVKL